MVPLFRKFTNISLIYLNHITRITDLSLLAIASDCCRYLTDFTLTDNKLVTDVSMIPLFKACAQLTTINITGSAQITDAAIAALCQNGSNKIANLNISQCVLLTDTSLEALSAAVFIAQLTHLNLQMCARITDHGLAVLMPVVGATLLHFDISYNMLITDAGLREIGDHCKKLTNITISFLSAVTQDEIKYVVDNGTSLKQMLSCSNQCTKFNR